jgi:hypothetical protein
MIKLKRNQEQIELVKAIGSRNKSESMAAQEAFAQAVGPVIGEVLMQMGTASLIYEDYQYGEDESPVFPLDFYYGEGAGAVTVWSASKAGGLPSNWIESSGELRFVPYDLESAVNFDKNYARKTFAFNVLSKAVERMVNEILIKQERQAWSVLLRALGEARTTGTNVGVTNFTNTHLIQRNTENILQLDDFNKLKTLAKRINPSYAAGTASNIYTSGVTNLFLSPEMMEQIRGFAYQPMNTRAGGESGTPAESVAVPLPDSIREDIFRNSGTSSIYGVGVTELNELGISQKYNVLFNEYAPASTFTVADDELVVGVDLTKGAFIRAVKNDGSGSATVEVDDQFLARSKKVGWYTNVSEARVCLDARAIAGIIV